MIRLSRRSTTSFIPHALEFFFFPYLVNILCKEKIGYSHFWGKIYSAKCGPAAKCLFHSEEIEKKKEKANITFHLVYLPDRTFRNLRAQKHVEKPDFTECGIVDQRFLRM